MRSRSASSLGLGSYVLVISVHTIQFTASSTATVPLHGYWGIEYLQYLSGHRSIIATAALAPSSIEKLVSNILRKLAYYIRSAKYIIL